MKYSIEKLQQQVTQHSNVEYLFFWGHTPKSAEIIDRSCFSQWYSSPIIVSGIVYATAEHWMMAKKALLFNDTDMLTQILGTEKPAVAKELGRKVKNFDATIWRQNAYNIVVEGNFHKFSQHPSLRKFLLQTGKKIIVEASPSDRMWGIGLSHNSEEALNPFKWKGTNWLGFALMEVRDLLLNGDA